jgi:hypothetical protein
MGATEAKRGAAVEIAIVVTGGIVMLIVLAVTSIVVVDGLVLAQGPQMMTDTTDQLVDAPIAMMTDLMIKIEAAVIEKEVDDALPVQKVLEPSLRLLNPQKMNVIVVQSLSNNSPLASELKSL